MMSLSKETCFNMSLGNKSDSWLSSISMPSFVWMCCLLLLLLPLLHVTTLRPLSLSDLFHVRYEREGEHLYEKERRKNTHERERDWRRMNEERTKRNKVSFKRDLPKFCCLDSASKKVWATEWAVRSKCLAHNLGLIFCFAIIPTCKIPTIPT